jgi:hypothetical protein
MKGGGICSSSVGRFVLPNIGAGAGTEGEEDGAQSSGMRIQRFGFKVGPLEEATEVGTGFSFGAFVLCTDGVTIMKGGGICSSNVGRFGLPNIGAGSGTVGEEDGAQSSGMRIQRFGFKVGPLEETTAVGTGLSVGAFVLCCL